MARKRRMNVCMCGKVIPKQWKRCVECTMNYEDELVRQYYEDKGRDMLTQKAWNARA